MGFATGRNAIGISDAFKATGFMTLGAAGATAAGMLGSDLPPAWLMDMTEKWGPGFLMVVMVMSGVVYYVPRSAVRDFVKSQQDQAVALNGLSRSVEQIAGHEGKLDTIILNQRVITKRLASIEGKLYGRQIPE